VKTKKIKIIIGDQYVEVTIEFDEDEIDGEELIAGNAFYTAYALGLIKVEIEDIDNEEHCHDQDRLQ